MTFPVLDGNATLQDMQSSLNNNGEQCLTHNARDFYLQVAGGFIPGYSGVGKFGFNPLVTAATDPEDVWEGGGVYNFSAYGTGNDDIVSLASDNAADTEPILVVGLNALGEEVEQVITLTGTTRVALTTALSRVYRMINIGTSDIAGTVFCYTGTGAVPSLGDANVRAVIDNGNNQTQMAIYTVPKGKVAFLVQGESGMLYEAGGPASSSAAARLSYRVRPLNGVFTIKRTVSLLSTGSSIYSITAIPGVIPALTDVLIRVENVSEDMGIWSNFELILVDDTEFTTAQLQAIGQPGSGGGNPAYPT